MGDLARNLISIERNSMAGKSKIVAVTLYPCDLRIVSAVRKDYDCNRSAATRMIIRDYGRMHALATERHITVRELTDIIFSSFAQGEG